MPPKYQRLDPISHIHKRPAMYVGPIDPQKEYNEWVSDLNEKVKIIKIDEIRYSQGLLRIFVEPLSNAIDNVWRSTEANINCSKIKININYETGETSIWNDGLTIPIEINEENQMYNPELIFGNLLTSSNYDDDEKRLVSGKNGIGVKLTNVFSTSFKIRTFDPNSKQMYMQEWKDNMRKKKKPRITSPKSQKIGFTEVSWTPDFNKFNMTGYDVTTLSVLYRYVYDAAMLTKVGIYINGKKIPIKNLQDYAKLYLEEPTKEVIYFSSKNCEVVLTPSTGNFEHIAFTNGVFNKDGGVHVDSWTEDILRPIVNKFNKPKKPQVNIKDIKQFFRIFINATVVNPEFNNQAKTKLISPNIKTNVTDTKIKSIMKWNFNQEVNDIIKGKELVNLKKTEKKRYSFKKIKGLDPANNAGSKKGRDCTLILCEGLSAKTYAVVGISVGFNNQKGRDWFGIYPLRGKLLNVRNANTSSITNNKEITDIVQALGIRHGVDYSIEKNYNDLNYGKVMIMTDADYDGIHISSLIMNFFHSLFPSLLQRDKSFITSMQTPIAKISYKNEILTFYSDYEFNDYKLKNINKNFKVKYYKGLGTSSDKEVKETFGQKVYEYVVNEELDNTMNKVFLSKQADKRKEWLQEYNPDIIIENSNQKISQVYFSNYLDIELIKFSIDDCNRSIPHLMDGLKQSHRKILYAVFLKGLKPTSKSMKVAQLAGFVAEKTNYHHGEQCLFETITKMAHEFPGSNNIPYLERDGQFGTRLSGGKDAANARYIFTKFKKLTRLLFREEDDILLSPYIDDGEVVEPKYYIPVLPTILINGCTAGIGTGWSSSVPCYNPSNLIDCIKIWLINKSGIDENGNYLFPELTPWYKGYKGKIEKINDDKFISYGNIYKSGRKIIVDELPIGMWTDKFKELLEDLIEKKSIKSIKNYSTPVEVKFEIIPNTGFECSLETLKLQTNLSTGNIVLFNPGGKLFKYSVNEVIDNFCKVRYNLYIKRKKNIISQIKNNLLIFQNKRNFLEGVINKKIKLFNIDESDIIKDLQEKEFDKISIGENNIKNYDYLLNMNIRSFSKNKLNSIDKNIKDLNNKLELAEKTKIESMWLKEIKDIEDILNST